MLRLSNRFSLCAFACILFLYFLIDTWNINDFFDLILSYHLPGFSYFWIFIPFYFAKYQHLSSHCFNFLFKFNFPLCFFIYVRFSFLFWFNSKFTRYMVLLKVWPLMLCSYSDIIMFTDDLKALRNVPFWILTSVFVMTCLFQGNIL